MKCCKATEPYTGFLLQHHTTETVLLYRQGAGLSYSAVINVRNSSTTPAKFGIMRM